MHKKPKNIFIPHPIFGWLLSPNSQIQVSHRENVIQNIDNNGNRTVPKLIKNNHCAKLNVYGCSFTYGTGLTDDETYPAIIQKHTPHLSICNKGIGGHSTVQNYLRFRDDLKNNNVDMAIFGVISDHRYRNIAHPYRMKQHQSSGWVSIGTDKVPHIKINRNKNAEIVYTNTLQPCLKNADISSFLPNEYFIDLSTLWIFDEIIKLSQIHDIPVIIAILDKLDPIFTDLMLTKFQHAVDVSTPLDQNHTFMPVDIHPNHIANQIFANGILKKMNESKQWLNACEK